MQYNETDRRQLRLMSALAEGLADARIACDPPPVGAVEAVTAITEVINYTNSTPLEVEGKQILRVLAEEEDKEHPAAARAATDWCERVRVVTE